MLTARSSMSCSLMRDSKGSPVAVVVSGGVNTATATLLSTEYLDLTKSPSVWRSGPDMLLELVEAKVVILYHYYYSQTSLVYYTAKILIK